jgi:hypothetical protein
MINIASPINVSYLLNVTFYRLNLWKIFQPGFQGLQAFAKGIFFLL